MGEGKRIYVWYDAVIGYLSASIEWSARNGDPDAWKRWWHNDEARHLYFVGKDNIPFHGLFWPAQLMGYGGLHLPDNVPANQYVTFSGAKMASGRGIGLTIGEGLRLFEPTLCATPSPRRCPSTPTPRSPSRRSPGGSTTSWSPPGGTSSTGCCRWPSRRSQATVPAAGDRRSEDTVLLAAVDDALSYGADCIERVELRAGLRAAMEAAAKVNAYLNSTEPWKLASVEPDRAAAVLVTALEAVAGVRTGLAPYIPFSTAALDEVFGPVKGWERRLCRQARLCPSPRRCSPKSTSTPSISPIRARDKSEGRGLLWPGPITTATSRPATRPAR